MKITLVRHGEVMFDFKHKMYGRKNVKLSKKGVMDCLEVKDRIRNNHYDICLMSPLARCVETAFIIVGDRVLTQVDDRLLERDMGNFTEKERSLYDPSKYWDYRLNSTDEGVESVHEMFERCNDFLRDIKKKYKDKDVLVVSHESIIRVLFCIINDIDVNSDLTKVEIPISYIGEFEYK